MLRHKSLPFFYTTDILASMIKQLYSIYKPAGLTPLEALEKFRAQENLPQDLKMTYAGRLDPMAEGILLLVCGKKVHEKEKYLSLPKKYTARFLFGLSTDTFDLLGKVTKTSKIILNKEEVMAAVKNLKGEIHLKVPPYSSVPIHGKPSFMHARAGTLEAKDQPERTMTVTNVKILNSETISSKEVLKTATQSIEKVSGDFRQKEIIRLWKKTLGKSTTKFLVVDVAINCKSGTYIRSLAEHVGKQVNSPALLYHLKRDRVGKFDIKNSTKLANKKTSR